MSINPIIKLDIEDTSKANHLRLNKRSFIGIYPCGAHFDDDNLIVSCGIHDSFCCLKISLKLLKNPKNLFYFLTFLISN